MYQLPIIRYEVQFTRLTRMLGSISLPAVFDFAPDATSKIYFMNLLPRPIGSGGRARREFGWWFFLITWLGTRQEESSRWIKNDRNSTSVTCLGATSSDDFIRCRCSNCHRPEIILKSNFTPSILFFYKFTPAIPKNTELLYVADCNAPTKKNGDLVWIVYFSFCE